MLVGNACNGRTMHVHYVCPMADVDCCIAPVKYQKRCVMQQRQCPAVLPVDTSLNRSPQDLRLKFMLCRAVVAVARRNERVYNFVGREMLRGSMAALAHPIFTAAETLQLIRDILAQQLATSPGPRQVGIYSFVCLSVCWSVCLLFCLSVVLSVSRSVCLSQHRSRDKTEQGGVVCKGLSRPACRSSDSMHFSFPCLSACVTQN